MLNEADEAEKALDAARRFAEEGRYEESLERHRWFHDHALEIRPSYYGVRLSFALSDWAALGENYPPALLALREVRRIKTARIIQGASDRHLFHDVQAINERLGEGAATVDLFEILDATRPEFAMEVYHIVMNELVNARKYELADRYLGDPRSRFSRYREILDKSLQWNRNTKRDAASRKAFESNFADNVAVLIEILAATDELPLARELQSEALALVESPLLHHALAEEGT